MKNLPPMKCQVDDVVIFSFQDKIHRGVIEIADYEGALEHNFHSYDIFVEEDNCLYKHIPEKDILKKLG